MLLELSWHLDFRLCPTAVKLFMLIFPRSFSLCYLKFINLSVLLDCWLRHILHLKCLDVTASYMLTVSSHGLRVVKHDFAFVLSNYV